jgi:cytochrome P450
MHGYKRRVMSQGFSDSALRASEPILIEHISNLLTRLLEDKEDFQSSISSDTLLHGKDWTAAKNLSRWAAFMTFDIISDLAFNDSFHLLLKPDMRWIEKALGQFTHMAQLRGQSPEMFDRNYPFILFDPNVWFFAKFAGNLRKYTRLGLAMAKKRTDKAQRQDRKDVMHFILNAKDPETGKGFSRQEVWAESNLIIGAGMIPPVKG